MKQKKGTMVVVLAVMAVLLLPMSAFAQYRGRSYDRDRFDDRRDRRHERAHDRYERRRDRFQDRFGDRNNRRQRRFYRELRRDHRGFHDRRFGNDRRRFYRRW